METSYGTFSLGKKPYPEGTREKWIQEGRVLARSPKRIKDRTPKLIGRADNRQYLPPIGSQGSEGSCVHWAGTYYCKTANMKRQDPTLDVTSRANQCSPRFTYNLSNAGSDTGNFGHEPFELFMRYGVPSLSQLPYVAGEYSFLPDMDDFIEGLHRRTADYVWIWEWQPTASEILELKTWLEEGGIAVAALNADGFSSWDVGDPPWVGSTGSYNDINHMITVCGYGPGYYLVANSWGRYFGSNGFIVVDSDYFENYCADVFYPIEGTYEPVTHYAELEIDHPQRSDIRSVAFSVNDEEVWSHSLPPRSVPKDDPGTYYKRDTRDDWAVAMDLSSGNWTGDDEVTVECRDQLWGSSGTLTGFRVVTAGQTFVSEDTPVDIPDAIGGPAVATVSFEAGDIPDLHQKINCGSGVVEDWEADRDYSTVSGGAKSVWYAISGAGDVPEAVYKSRRYGMQVAYDMDVPDGIYNIRLHFAELWSSTVGARLFDVSIEGGEVLSNFDIAKESGGIYKAVTRTFEGVAVSGGLQIVADAVVGTAQFNGIEVWSSGPPAPAIVVDPVAVSVPEDGSVQFSVTLNQEPESPVTVQAAWASGDTDLAVSDGSALTFTAADYDVPQTVTVSAGEDADSENGTAVIAVTADGWTGTDVTAMEQDNDQPPLHEKINCGSGAEEDWEADRDYSTVSGGAKSVWYAISGAGDVPEAVYKSRRYGTQVAYDLDIRDGTYTVRLHFAELWTSTVGSRLFNVSIEGDELLSDFDIAKESGGKYVAVTRTFEGVAVSGGLQIVADAVVGTAQFNGIEVWSSGPPAPAVVVDPVAVSVPEGGSVQLSVTLNQEPESPVTVQAAWASGDTDLAVSDGSALTFTAADYDVPQTVTVSAGEDADSESGSAVIAVTADGWTGADVTATEQDNDQPPMHEKINCGSTAVEDWEADRDYSTVSGGAKSVWYAISGAGDVPEAVYKSRRYGTQVAYDLDMPDGTYTVRLHFAELWNSAIGSRLFNVSIEGDEVLSDFDIAKESGGKYVAITRIFEGVSVSGGLQIVADAVVGTAQFNGIEVWSFAVGSSPAMPAKQLSSLRTTAGTGPAAWARSGDSKWRAAPELVDGDPETAWTGSPEASSWAIAVDFKNVLLLQELGLDYEGIPCLPLGVVGSADLIEWTDLGVVETSPVACRAVYFQFGGNGSIPPPSIREVLWREEE